MHKAKSKGVNTNIGQGSGQVKTQNLEWLNGVGRIDFPFDMKQKNEDLPVSSDSCSTPFKHIPFQSKLVQPRRFEQDKKMQQVAQNLHALDLEISQKEYKVLISKEDRQRNRQAGVYLESLNLNTGYNGVLNMRERKIEDLAKKYKVEMSDF